MIRRDNGFEVFLQDLIWNKQRHSFSVYMVKLFGEKIFAKRSSSGYLIAHTYISSTWQFWIKASELDVILSRTLPMSVFGVRIKFTLDNVIVSLNSTQKSQCTNISSSFIHYLIQEHVCWIRQQFFHYCNQLDLFIWLSYFHSRYM